MKIAVEGCAHGELEKIYETIQIIEKDTDIKVDLLLCCGDFQATRNMDDLQTMAVPKKFQNMGSFYKYYSGELTAPILTIFIGGNHEASNYLQELPYGGWVAPKIYYLGYAGVVRVNGLRIAGLSGIYKGYDYLKGRYEFPPYNDSSRTSVYHIRQLETFRLKQLSGKVDICMSHDWPRGIWKYGNKDQLIRFKPHFRDDIEKNELGSRPCEELLNSLQPSFWFAAHLHCKFAALIPHKTYTKADFLEDTNEKVTKFLALDKCLPKRRFLQILAIDPPDSSEEGVIKLEYDLEWLTILYLTNHLTNVKPNKYYLPEPSNENSDERCIFTPSPEELDQVRLKFPDLIIPNNFCRTVDPYDGYTNYKNCGHVPQPKAQLNPQNTTFCDILGIDDPLSLSMVMHGHELNLSTSFSESITVINDSEEFSITDTSTTSLNQQSPLKRKTLLDLPKPSCDTNAQEMLGTEHKNSEVDIIGDISYTKDPEEKSIESTNSKPPIKKLRRRNQDLYEANIEEPEE